ncbi:MAG: hypothetical protein SPC89_05985 [Candidatus Methanarcanum hacksteinii]|nr:hypothetical protein [Candidatus Methanarcanum hacksteinii]
MCQREDLIVLDVPDVVADGVVAPLVGPEDLAAFLANPDLVLPVDVQGAVGDGGAAEGGDVPGLGG